MSTKTFRRIHGPEAEAIAAELGVTVSPRASRPEPATDEELTIVRRLVGTSWTPEAQILERSELERERTIVALFALLGRVEIERWADIDGVVWRSLVTVAEEAPRPPKGHKREALLEVLAHERRWMRGSEVAELAGLQRRMGWDLLRHLASDGLCQSERRGSERWYAALDLVDEGQRAEPIDTRRPPIDAWVMRRDGERLCALANHPSGLGIFLMLTLPDGVEVGAGLEDTLLVFTQAIADSLAPGQPTPARRRK